MVLPPQTSASLSGITGEATGSYFEDGNGTSAKPYIIATPKQLYYFNWLQDLGYFNKKQKDSSGSETSTYEQVYFKVVPKDGSSALDMADYTLPPAGTETYPFIGNFNGNGVAINNLTISNAESGLTDVPKQASISDGLLDGAKIVGFFGIVGQYETSIDYETSINAIDDLYFDNLTVESGASKTLAGFIAGYANGKIDNCGIHCGQFSFASGAKGLSNSDTLSKYTLIGDYSSNFTWDEQPGGGGSGSGSGTNWGSSIDVMDIMRRTNYINAVADQGVSSMDFHSSTYALYDKGATSSERLWDGTTNSTNYYYLYSGTVLPLSIDDTKAFTEETTTTAGNGNIWHTTQFYLDNKGGAGEYNIISNNNSGYLVGGGGLNEYGSLDDDVKLTTGRGYIILRHYSIANSIKNSAPGKTTYDGDATVYSVNTAEGHESKEITASNCESDFNYSEYARVKADFDSLHNGKGLSYGFHFYPMKESAIGYTSAKAKIFGTEYSDYQFLKGALNFTTKSSGFITTMLATCYSNYDTLFDLYKIERNASHEITDVKRIKKIYKNVSGSAEPYYYVYADDSDPTGLNLLFDFTQVTGKSDTALAKTYSLYYFEIPVNAGDYAISKSIDNATVVGRASDCYGECAYILYLDIGANGTVTPDSGQTTINKSNIDFVYKENGTLAKITDDGYTPSGVIFSVGATTATPKLIYFKRESKENMDTDTIDYVGVAYYTESSYTITASGNGESKEKEPDAD